MIRTPLRTVIKGFILLSICTLFTGCLGKTSPEVTYYSLLSMEQMGATVAAPTGSDLRIGIGPVTIPDSLMRTQLVTRDAQSVYRFDEFNRWAGVLEKDIAYVLGDNLGDLLGVNNNRLFPLDAPFLANPSSLHRHHTV